MVSPHSYDLQETLICSLALALPLVVLSFLSSHPPQFDSSYCADGLDKIGSMISYPSCQASSEFLLKRYLTKNVHHLQGLKDKGVGDDRPQALAQG